MCMSVCYTGTWGSWRLALLALCLLTLESPCLLCPIYNMYPTNVCPNIWYDSICFPSHNIRRSSLEQTRKHQEAKQHWRWRMDQGWNSTHTHTRQSMQGKQLPCWPHYGSWKELHLLHQRAHGLIKSLDQTFHLLDLCLHSLPLKQARLIALLGLGST